MGNKFLLGLIMIFLFGSISAQELKIPELDGFKKITNYPVYQPDNLWDFINGAAETYLAYGFIDLHVAEYKKGKNIIKLELYHHDNNTFAFGIYSTERSPSFRFMNLGAQGYITGGSINFFKGNYYVKIRTFSKSEKTLRSAKSLALRVSNMLEGNTEMPSGLSLFPEEGKKLNEETYINESVLGHRFLNKAYKAIYEVGPDKFSIYIFNNNSPGEAWTIAEDYLEATGIEALESTSGKYVLEDKYNGPVFLAWKDDVVVLISGLSKDQSNLAYKYSTEIFE
jgi:Family of unknown function (DUF6599)